MKEKIHITVDGIPHEAEEGAMLLGVLTEMGIEVPTLCHHPSLEPSGACRLCVVEITHADWKGWSGLVTSCLYPVEPGLIVDTMSPRVRQERRTLLELYMAQCPDSEALRRLARSQGVDRSPFPAKEQADKCVMCGLCFRVCQDLGPSALASLSRGTGKRVGPRPDCKGEDCTGCTACAHICPTGEIAMERKNGKLNIWNRTFDIPVCTVDPETCRGCGVCEEVCPLAIPRVTVFRNGARVAKIAAEPCIGCGICAGVCPTGAIRQEVFPTDALCGRTLNAGDLRGKTITFACSRSPLPGVAHDSGARVSHMQSFGERVSNSRGFGARNSDAPGSSAGNSDGYGLDDSCVVIPVPCVGRVTAENVLECLARGADGVMLMCRDKASCPSGRGGELAEHRAATINELIVSVGMGEGRVVFTHPPSGFEGPANALGDFTASMHSSPLKRTYTGSENKTTGMDHALEIMRWFRARPELTPRVPPSLVPALGDGKGNADTLLYVGDLADLDLLLSLVVHEKRLATVIEDAAALLGQSGIAFRPAFTKAQVEASPASRVVTFCACCSPAFEGAKQVTTLDALAGCVPAATQMPEDYGFRFRMTPKERQAHFAALAGSNGARSYYCPYALARQWDLTRMGSWQDACFKKSRMAFSDAVHETAGVKEAGIRKATVKGADAKGLGMKEPGLKGTPSKKPHGEENGEVKK